MPIRKIHVHSIDDLLSLKETIDVEFKKSAGKDGRGKIPSSFWETYSAFANAEGGYIFLGIEEKSDKTITIVGIKEYEKIKQDLYNQANNSNLISSSLVNNASVEVLKFNNKAILKVYIPRADRKNRPVYVKGNPIKGSYIRRNEGDYLLDANAVKKMLAEQGENSVDSIILRGFGIDDLNIETIQAYRNTFAALSPNHPFVSKDIPEFLKLIGASNKDRETNEEGLTLAGLLMFGKLTSILDEVPNYILDYQEHPESKTEGRWLDRFTTDGTWSGNLYDFYRRVYHKITSDLKIPFQLKQGTRIEDTPAHEALREVFVNSLIHADYSGRVSVLITKRPGMFSFRNPGLMRVPIEQAIEGGNSDCRNRKLQKMFQFVGAGDQAGSGIPKIYQNWKQQHWRAPLIREKREPEQTIFELHTVSLMDENSISILDNKFGKDFRTLEELQRLILATTVTEQIVNHKRILEITTKHPSDISKAFAKLAKEGFLVAQGEGRGTVYSLPNQKYVLSSGGLPSSSGGLPSSSGGLPSSSGGLPSSSGGFGAQEEEISVLARTRKKLARNEMETIIIKLCFLQPQSLENLARLLDRNSDFLRKTYIMPMVKRGKINPIYADATHPKQAYKSPATIEE